MLDHLEDNIRRVIADIRPQMLEKVIENWTSRLDYIRASRGSHMPGIIFKMPQTLDKPARFSERHFIPHILHTPAKREPARQCKVCCSKKDALMENREGRKHATGVMIKGLFQTRVRWSSALKHYCTKFSAKIKLPSHSAPQANFGQSSPLWFLLMALDVWKAKIANLKIENLTFLNCINHA
ncbi:hypothetical protein TNCV_3629881 [Trichonephila clavipes]|nr:hypothetical protein TNCV_3629881 [Trichonephila clavipes]